jgi:hypothetical protein
MYKGDICNEKILPYRIRYPWECVVPFDFWLLFAKTPFDGQLATDGCIPITHLSRFNNCLYYGISPMDWFFRRTWRG